MKRSKARVPFTSWCCNIVIVIVRWVGLCKSSEVVTNDKDALVPTRTGCLSFSGIPGPHIFQSDPNNNSDSTALFGHELKSDRSRIAAVGSDISNRNRARIVVKSGPIQIIRTRFHNNWGPIFNRFWEIDWVRFLSKIGVDRFSGREGAGGRWSLKGSDFVGGRCG